MKKTKLSFISIVLLFTFTACELETIDGCEYCELNYEIMSTSSLTLTELNELAVEIDLLDIDNYDDLNSHFLPALIKKIHNIKENKKSKLVLWGNGLAKREVVYVDDIADACIYFMKKKIKENVINIGTGKDYTIKTYAKLILNLICPKKKIRVVYDKTKPNGTPRKVLDISHLSAYF